FDGDLILIGEEKHRPYDRPPLSKEVLRREAGQERLALRRKSYDALRVELRLGQRAQSLDAGGREILLQSGEVVSYDGLVIATGGEVRTLPNQPSLEGIHVLRTLDDAMALRAALETKPTVAVIGAGFIGAEVAASARQLGLDVTMIEALETPLAQSLGTRLGRILQEVHERRGVKILCGRRVEKFGGDRHVESVWLDDGSKVDCGLVVVGIGVTPSISWLGGSGIELEDGVRCDETLATSVAGVVAAGDVASWYNPLFEERMRVEHWTNAVEQARHAASTLLAEPGEAKPFESVPMFWSDQFDIKIQGSGSPKPGDELTIVRRGPDGEKLIAIYSRAGRVVGAVTFNQPPKLVQLRMLIGKRGRLDEAMKIVDS
ncbi:MAG: FAD-dependent oxidoreductase, partial [Myxococcales bacterium]|nr:FAD-dependent oxidoreductase [Myxococcales bacterium]